jgi:hypothetical protein
MVGLLILMQRRLGGLEGRQIMTGALKATLATFGMGAILWLWLQFTAGQPAWLVAIGGVLFGVPVYGCGILLLNVGEARQMVSGLLQRVKGG